MLLRVFIANLGFPQSLQLFQAMRWLEQLSGVEYYLPYQLSFNGKNGVIQIEKLDDFDIAQRKIHFLEVKQPPLIENMFYLNLGHHDLSVLVDYLEKEKVKENIVKFNARTTPSYSGLPFD